MSQTVGGVCRKWQRGACSREQCPLLHALPPQPCLSERQDVASQAAPLESSSESWTQSSSSRSWADMSEDLWAIAGPLGRWQTPEAPATRTAGAGSSHDELPSFLDRIAIFPEWFPTEGGGSLPREFGDDMDGHNHKSKSAMRRRQRKMSNKWSAMKELNNATSAPVLRVLNSMPPQLPPVQHAPRTESASPQRPLAPAPSPRRPRRIDQNDPDDSGDGGLDVKNTKISL
ncbi:unnamed protein product [Prorocentrum cordatum]|uniref:C3H1-type domain-containing protein n=1 Tax=Prorocentrum cordatum TaxID=2364126 RepID=A0ABN9QIR0_9DINO|nr:unnamed protein product [Polarella glacialis]